MLGSTCSRRRGIGRSSATLNRSSPAPGTPSRVAFPAELEGFRSPRSLASSCPGGRRIYGTTSVRSARFCRLKDGESCVGVGTRDIQGFDSGPNLDRCQQSPSACRLEAGQGGNAACGADGWRALLHLCPDARETGPPDAGRGAGCSHLRHLHLRGGDARGEQHDHHSGETSRPSQSFFPPTIDG